MALFLIAFLGIGLLALFLFQLADVPSYIVREVLKWTSSTVLALSFVLFILSGRILYATLLVVIVGVMLRRYRKKHSPHLSTFALPSNKKKGTKRK